ncbi:MAG: hypothetical protein ABJA71_07890 [Ginsengibacter sp.]
MSHSKRILLVFIFISVFNVNAQKNKPASSAMADNWKKEVMKEVDGKYKMAQEMVDMVFSFAELGFQETETSAYLTNVLEKKDFNNLNK